MNQPFPPVSLAFGTPRKFPKVAALHGRVVVLDIAFASEASGKGFEGITLPFIERLGNRLAAWVDHHDHNEHARFQTDDRFVLSTKAEHGACPEMITAELVHRIGPVDTVLCHNDFDGLASAAKWIRQGVQPYPDCDADAYAIDTRIGAPSEIGRILDRALRARPRDMGLCGLVVRYLATGAQDTSLWVELVEASRGLDAIEANTRELARSYTSLGTDVVGLVVPAGSPSIDKTMLLLLGQQRAKIALVIDRDTVSLATPFDGGVNLLTLLGLSGGMPTRVSVPSTRLRHVCTALGLDPQRVMVELQIELEV